MFWLKISSADSSYTSVGHVTRGSRHVARNSVDSQSGGMTACVPRCDGISTKDIQFGDNELDPGT